MKVIDLLQRISNKKDIPKVVKILDNTLLPDFRILEWNEVLELYEHIDKTEFNCVLDKYHLDLEVDIIGETPKEDKKIKRIQSCGDNLYSEYIGQWLVNKENYSEYDELLMNKINEIIAKINGDSNE